MKLIISAALISICVGQVPEFNAGRPGQAETITIVNKGYFQLESNWTPTAESGSSMLRTGLSKRMEARMSIDEFSPDGFGAGSAGILFHISEQKGKLPGMGAALSVSMPALDGSLQTGQIQYDAVFPFSLGINDRTGLDWHLGISAGASDPELSYASVLGYGITDKLGAFAGLYGAGTHAMDTGITFMITENIQFDLNGGIPLSSDGDGKFFDLGMTIRLPK